MAIKQNPENLYSPGDFAVFGGIYPLFNVEQLTSWTEQITGNGTLQREFTWSHDGLFYHEWETLTETTLQAVPVLKTIDLVNGQFQIYLDHKTNSIIISGLSPVDEVYELGQSFPYAYNWTDLTGFHQVEAGQILTNDIITALYNQYVSTQQQIQGDFGSNFNSNFAIQYTFVNKSALTLQYPDRIHSRPVYIKFRYTLLTGGPVSVYPVIPVVTYIAKEKYANQKPPAQECSDSGCRTGLVFDGKFSYNINDQSQLGCLFEDLTNAINQMIGLDVQYFRLNPIKSSADVILHEWTLYNVEPKCYNLKVVIPKNEFPDNKINWNAYGSDYNMPFEGQISKDYYEGLLGKGKAPQKGDIMYFSENNRIYQITSSTLEKNFLQIGIYYRVSLVKYQPKSNNIFTKEIEEEFDLKTISSEDIFGEQVNFDILNVTNPQQTGSTQKNYDMVRGFVDPNLSIPREKIINYYTTIADSFYNLSALVPKDFSNVLAVQYNKLNQFSENDDRGLSVWFRQPNPQKYKSYIPDSSSFVGNVGTLVWSKANDYQIGQEIQLFTTSVSVNAVVTSLSPFTITVPTEVVDNLNAVNPAWQYQNFKTRHYLSKYLINSNTNGTGWYLKMHTGITGISYLECKINTTSYYYFLPNELAINTWYGLHLNLSHTFLEINLNIWKIQWDIDTNQPQTSELQNIFTDSRSLPAYDKSSQMPYQIPASELHIANLRVWKKYYENSRQSNLLNQNMVKEVPSALIIDNTNEQSRLPQLGETK